MIGFAKQIHQVMGVYSVFVGLHGHSALQSFKCVGGGCGHIMCIHKAHFPLGTAVLSSLHSGVVVML